MKKFKLLTIITVICLTMNISSPAFALSTQSTFNTANVLTIGSTAAGRLDGVDNIDYHRFELSSSGQINVDFEIANDQVGTFFLKLFNGAGDLLMDTNNSGYYGDDPFASDYGAQFRYRLANGTYYVKLETYSYASSGYDYDLTVSFTPEDDGSHVNKTNGEPTILSVNKPIIGGLSPNDLIDRYQFTLTETTTLTLAYNFQAGSPNHRVTLTKGVRGGTEYLSSWVMNDRAYPFSVEVALEPGTYYLSVSGEFLPNVTDDYTLTIIGPDSITVGTAPDETETESSETEVETSANNYDVEYLIRLLETITGKPIGEIVAGN